MNALSANDLDELIHVLNQFHLDIHQLRLGRGEAKKVFGRDEYMIFKSGLEQAEKIRLLCNQELAAQLSPVMGKRAKSFLFDLSKRANQFLNNIKLKHGLLGDIEVQLLENLEPIVKHFLDSMRSGNQIMQSNKKSQVILGEQHEEPIVCGEKQNRLTEPGFKVIKTLLDANRPLTKDELTTRSGKGDAVNILKRLKKLPGWCKVIQLAGTSGRGYSIISRPK